MMTEYLKGLQITIIAAEPHGCEQEAMLTAEVTKKNI